MGYSIVACGREGRNRNAAKGKKSIEKKTKERKFFCKKRKISSNNTENGSWDMTD